MIDAMRAWAREEGAAPTSGDWTPASDPALKWAREFPRWPSNVTVKTLFGSWREGVAAAGLQPRRRRWDRTSIRAALQRFAAVHGRAPGSTDLEQREELPAPGTVRAHYGSLAAALDAAALPVQRRRRANVFVP